MNDNDNEILKGGEACGRYGVAIALLKRCFVRRVRWGGQHVGLVAEVDDADGLASEEGDHVHVDPLAHEVNEGGLVAVGRKERRRMAVVGRHVSQRTRSVGGRVRFLEDGRPFEGQRE